MYFPQDDILRRVAERNAMAGLAEHEENDAEVPDAINEIEIEMVESQQVPQVVENVAGNDEPQFEMADENAETEQQHQVPQIEEDNGAGNVQPSEENPKADDPPVEPVVNDPPVEHDHHAVMRLIRPCFVSIPKIRSEPVYQPYPFRSPRQGTRERNVRVKCAVCHRIFRMNNVPFDFDVESNICSKECALR